MRRLVEMGNEANRLADRIDGVLDGANVWSALFALGLTGNMVALSDGVSIEQNAEESLFARGIVKALRASNPDPLYLARVFAQCLSFVANDAIYAPKEQTSLAERKRVYEID